LNWKTDPVLFDTTSQHKYNWETANSLIVKGWVNQVFQPTYPRLSLYPIMIRREDFTSKERLLQTMPYIVLLPYWKDQLRKHSLKIAERCASYFNDTIIDYSILKWQKKIILYCDQQHRIPFPLFRLADTWEDYFISTEFISFQSARGEAFHMPTLLSCDLAYFMGVVIGDGHLNYHNVELVDFSQKQMILLRSIAKKLFGFEGMISGEKKIWLLHLNNKWLVRLVNFLIDQPITGKKYESLTEPLIFNYDELLRRHFWSGALDADGSYKGQISFCSTSESFIQVFGSFLAHHQIQYKVRELDKNPKGGYVLNTNVNSKEKLQHLLFPRHAEKIRDFQAYVKSKTYTPRQNRSDTLTKMLQAQKSLHFQAFDEEKIIEENGQRFFNFSLLPTLGILQCQELLKTLRNYLSWTQKEIAEFLTIPEKVFTSYENVTDIPIRLLEKLLPLFPKQQPKAVMSFLQENNLFFFRSRKTVARLDIQPSEKLLDLLKNLELRRGYLLINCQRDEKETFHKKLEKYFALTNILDNKLSNSVLYQFAKTFCKV